ncbi:Aminopeptidase N [Trichinella papuae]|uniref:Aminopeptidase N n=1 Tax=Trichinella papuae TaxID=268474 RepID=A0A0V1MEN6_9BILA|nr:Aminopeptidase N [Trichinella papuae]
MEQEVVKSRPKSKSRRLITTITVTTVVIVLLCILVGLVIYFMSKTLRQPMPANARLPKSVKPMEYILKVQVYYPNSATTSPSDKLFTFDGNLTVEIECINSTKNITMNVEEIDIIASSLKLIEKDTKKKIEFSNPAFEVESVAQMVTFYPTSELEPNKRYFLSMSYTGKLADDLQGFYRANYTVEKDNRWILVTQFEPTDARRALPCFDEPEFKSVFTLTVIHPANTTALSNMPAVYTKIIRRAFGLQHVLSNCISLHISLYELWLQEHSFETGPVDPNGFLVSEMVDVYSPIDPKGSISTTLATPGVDSLDHLIWLDAWIETSFQPSVQMSSYLFAIAVVDFPYQESYESNERLKFRIWTRESLMDQIDFALYAGPKVLNYFVEKFDYPFPLPKQDMLAVPDFGPGAMENWGLVTYRETALLYKSPKLGGVARCFSVIDKLRVARIIAHELAHQWFGNLVTMLWWDSVWLNEGFADFVGFLGTQHILQEWPNVLEQQFIFEQIQMAMAKDQEPQSPPIHRSSTQTDLFTYFDYITYKKGASIIRMLEYVMKNDFWVGLKAVMESESPSVGWDSNKFNVSIFMDSWVNAAGFPVVAVNRVNGSHVQLSQSRFIVNLTEDNATNVSTNVSQQWYIPLWYKTCTNKGITSLLWLQPNSTVMLAIEDDCWLMFNSEVRSFARLHYDDATWQRLLSGWSSDILSIERSQLISDAFNLALIGNVNYSRALELVQRLPDEVDAVPWKSAFIGLNYLQDMLFTHPGGHFFFEYVQKILNSAYKTDLWNNIEVDDFKLSVFSGKIVEEACGWNVTSCRDVAVEKFKEFMEDCQLSDDGSSNCSKVPALARRRVYCTGIEQKHTTDFERLWHLCNHESIGIEKENLLYGLSCCEDSDLLLRLLNASLQLDKPCIRRQDVGTLFKFLGNNPVARQIMWQHMKSRWSEYIKKKLKQPLKTMTMEAVRTFNTAAELEELNQFVNEIDGDDNKQLFNNAVKMVEINVHWRNSYAESVIDFVQQALLRP